MKATPPTATQLAAIKREAKRRVKSSDGSYNATLEQVAREHGFDSWYAAMQQHKSADPTDAGPAELVINPDLPAGFDDTPNKDRSAEELEQWWMRPFAHVTDDGRYEVRCLDGGAWDRSTWYGIADDLGSARALAKTKLVKWRSFLDTPTVTIEEGRVFLTVDSLRPDVPRAVLATFDTQALAVSWLEDWKLLVATQPALAQTKLAQARARMLRSTPGSRDSL